MKKLNLIKWHDSPIDDLIIDFNKGNVKMNFQEFGTLSKYMFLAKDVLIKKIILEKELDISNCEISSLNINEIDDNLYELTLGIYSPMNGYLKMIFISSKVLLEKIN
jgi:hypothetical protein